MSKKILVVDDDESILDAISLILEDAGYQVEIIFKGNEVFAKINEFNPDLILLDVLMSGNDGRHICNKLKTQENTRQIPVIMISAHPSAESSIKECGADDFLAKPFNTSDLLTIVKKNL